ncbi:Phosphatidyl-N-methylethanolamine N-methyltransferase [Dimargaris cristalligena]|uniref:Phosphatidyl-N-methylethanolamine N-methyltransferase n=1 Tax=Dimargaris cristalligena TaxID=215637 RepID=A0A4P9ZSU4_9FUNG|nr:Phosphatidyl-N-methylethanolamine N-methyltransferase [Dimargaris cristalligena]RKP35891.1 YJR073Cp-like protein [Dimargaris cristalligena]|eukprot:RKP35891.1 YJR073Cp-like protein [Dimargaris cristalligena]
MSTPTDQSVLHQLCQLVDWHQPTLWYAVACILFNPLFWNIAARQEYRHHWITKLACGNAYVGCYMLAITIFSLGIFRDAVYNLALDHQPTAAFLAYGEIKIVAAALWAVGMLLVLTSTYQLGITGTYLGDYFGILMNAKVTKFPFNATNNPMYQGSTLAFLGVALWKESVAGLILSVLVFVVYSIALHFEEPFTNMIYAKREKSS